MKIETNGYDSPEAVETFEVEERPEAAALRRIIDAYAAGQPPAPEDVARLQALHTAETPQLNIKETIDDLLADEPRRREAAWENIAPLLQPPPRVSRPLSKIPHPPPRQWIIPNWLPRGRFGMLTGEGGRGKSWLALQLAAAMCREGGDPHWLGNAMPPAATGQSVLIATWEDEPGEYVRRLSPNTAAALDSLHVIDMAGAGPLWGTPTGGFTQTRAVLLTTGETVRKAAIHNNADLLIIDPLAAAYGANENDRAAVREFVSSWDRWGIENDCAVMIIAHPPKSPSTQPSNSAITGYSGSTDWHSASRWRWELTHQSDSDTTTLKCAKASYAIPPDNIPIKRNDQPPYQWQQIKQIKEIHV